MKLWETDLAQTFSGMKLQQATEWSLQYSKCVTHWESSQVISQINTQTNPALALLHLGTDQWPCNLRDFPIHALIAARKTVAGAWKQKSAPDKTLFIF